MKPNSDNNEPDDLEMQPSEAEKYMRAKSATRPKSGPVPNLRPKQEPHAYLRPKSGPVSTARPKSGPLENINRKSGPVPMPKSSFPADQGLELALEADNYPLPDRAGPRDFPQDGPGPSQKVDFENLPEFVKQRRMLKIVRVFAILVTLGLAIGIGSWVYLTFWGAKTAVKDVIEKKDSVENNNRPLVEENK